jgi:hypothetical protein
LKLFPSSAYIQLEFDKVRSLLLEHCETEYAKEKTNDLLIHTNKELIETELKQSYEYKQLLQSDIYFPNDHLLNLSKELKDSTRITGRRWPISAGLGRFTDITARAPTGSKPQPRSQNETLFHVGKTSTHAQIGKHQETSKPQ